jgi:halocyanin-like protein
MATDAATQTPDGGASSTRRRFLRGAVPAVGAAALGSRGVRAQETSTPAQQRPDWGGWLDGIDGGYRDARGQDSVTVRVGASGNGGAFAFEPAGLWVDPGTTITFQWTGQGGGHNVVADSGPAEIDSGGPVDETGYTYEFTPEQGGITNYVCEPHVGLGMKGAIAVGDDVPTVAYSPPSAEGESEGGILQAFADAPPGTPFLLVFYAAGGLGAALVLGAEYGGDLYRWRKKVVSTTVTETEEVPELEAERELDHDEYDPTGTAALVVVYLAIIALMWVFMYFVEFLGRATVGV